MAWDDDDLDDEPLDDPGEEESDDQTIPCPYCRAAVYEDAERCPQCGQYLSAEDAPPSRKPWWIVAGAIGGLVGMLWWALWP